MIVNGATWTPQVVRRRSEEGVRIIAGMRWTVWAACASMPFGVVTSALMARTSPEAAGTYGLLALYIGMVTAFLYLGGDAVTIHFIPQIPQDARLSFLLSYYGVILAGTVAWLAGATVCSNKLHYLFGHSDSTRFQTAMLAAAPVYIFYSMMMAALKGLLELPKAVVMMRGLPVAFCLLYGGLFVFARTVVVHNYGVLIWTLYFTLVGICGVWGLVSVVRLTLRDGGRVRAHLFLPRGFWPYVGSTQLLGMASFFTLRLDYLLVLNSGGLSVLGRYVILATVAGTIVLLTNLFRDTLLPSLSHLLARQRGREASDVWVMHMRLVFLVNMIATSGLIVLAGRVLSVFGAQYGDLWRMMVLMACFSGVAAPGLLGTALLQSVGKHHLAIGPVLAQIGGDIAMFSILWPRYGLLGGVLAYGLSVVPSSIGLWLTAARRMPFEVRGSREYAHFGVISCVLAGLILGAGGLGTIPSLVVSGGAVLAFARLTRYTVRECMEMLEYFVPQSAAIFRRVVNSGVGIVQSWDGRASS